VAVTAVVAVMLTAVAAVTLAAEVVVFFGAAPQVDVSNVVCFMHKYSCARLTFATQMVRPNTVVPTSMRENGNSQPPSDASSAIPAIVKCVRKRDAQCESDESNTNATR
jgi:hypothetical protein